MVKQISRGISKSFSNSVPRATKFFADADRCLSLFDLALGPGAPLDAELNGSQTPVLAVVVGAAEQTGASLGLVVAQDRQDAKDDGDGQVELGAHEAV